MVIEPSGRDDGEECHQVHIRWRPAVGRGSRVVAHLQGGGVAVPHDDRAPQALPSQTLAKVLTGVADGDQDQDHARHPVAVTSEGDLSATGVIGGFPGEAHVGGIVTTYHEILLQPPPATWGNYDSMDCEACQSPMKSQSSHAGGAEGDPVEESCVYYGWWQAWPSQSWGVWGPQKRRSSAWASDSWRSYEYEPSSSSERSSASFIPDFFAGFLLVQWAGLETQEQANLLASIRGSSAPTLWLGLFESNGRMKRESEDGSHLCRWRHGARGRGPLRRGP